MKIIKALHSLWVGERVDHPKTKRSWLALDKAIAEAVPAEKQAAFTSMIEAHCYSVEYSGFLAGFKTAMKLWKEI